MSACPYSPEAPDGLLADLNPAQRQAVTQPDGPLLVVAGAGTGKTRVLTRRVAWLVRGGVPAHAVLAITFTNKAAEELKRRLADLPGAGQVWAGTFHGFGAFLLRRHGEALDLDPRFTILDRDDQRTLLKALSKDLGLDTSVLRPADAAAFISHRKSGGGGRAPRDLFLPGVAAALDALAQAYVQRCRRAGLLDFDDLLLESVRLLGECEDVADLYHARFRHVLVDEYQDTNVVQRELLLRLVGPESNLTVVGDPDQSIYRWRGATVRNILDFAQDFPGARTVLLERNYRSTGHILEAAEAVIARNRERHAKRLFTDREDGPRVRVTRCRDAEDEGRVAARQIARWQQAGRHLDDIAVFYRVNALSRGIELALGESGIPYVVVAGTEFFQRREVKDALAYARLVANPRDEASFLRVVNLPRRGMGATSLRRLRDLASREGLSLAEAARRAGEAGISRRAAKGLASFLDLLDAVRAMPPAPVAPILRRLLEDSGLAAALEASDDALDRGRVENVRELVAHAREYDRKEPEGDLFAFLERVALVSDQDGYRRDSGRVSLMSVHAAKGLEFDCVLLSGAELGYFPHARSMGEDAEEEEERRLFYVALTRAREQLAILHAARRHGWMGEEDRLPSPYLRDLPASCLAEVDLTAPGAGSQGWDEGSPGSFDENHVVRETGPELEAGVRVLHPYFGPGRLEDVSGAGEDTRVTVEFDTHGRRQLLLRHARLERLP
jgi:DNA helicase-2/ATP-dependent DNA helicase PcrA